MNKSDQYYLLPSLLLLVVFFLPLWPSYFVVKVEGFPGFDLPRILMMLLVVFWFLSLVTSTTLQWRLKYEIYSNKHIFMLFGLFFIWKLCSVIHSPHMLKAVFSALKDIIYYFILFSMALTIWKEKNYLIPVIKTMVVSSIIISILVMIEYILQYNFIASLTPQLFGRLQNGIDVTMRDGFYRAQGTFANSLALASYVVMMLPISGWMLWKSRGKWRALSFMAFVGLLCCVYMTGSRIALLTLALLIAGSVCFFLFDWWKREKGKAKMLVAILLLFSGVVGTVGVTFIGLDLAGGRSAKEASSSDVRLRQLEWGIPLILKQPFMGYGPGEAAETLGISAKTVDNYFLTLGLESGFFVAVMFAMILCYFLWKSWHLKDILPRTWSELSMALFLVVGSDILFMSVISLEQTIPLMFLMFAMICVLDSDATQVLHERLSNLDYS